MPARPLDAVVSGGPDGATVSLTGQIDRDADHPLEAACEGAGALMALVDDVDPVAVEGG
jgi:hypothetical protein